MGNAGPLGAPLPVNRRREWAIRIASAILLVAVFAAATLAGVWVFASLALGLSIAAAWEWGGLVRGRGVDAVFWLQSVVIGLAVAVLFWGAPWSAVAIIVAGAVTAALVRGPADRIWSAAGFLYIGLPCLALVWLRQDEASGAVAVLFIVTVVSATDSGAFFFGRLVGGAKLWPALSPNKTWAGFLGGWLSAVAAALLFAWGIGHPTPLWMALIAVVLAPISVAGDLSKSALKRRFGRKDMSGLIPGHGGILDRVDGLIFASLAAALFALLVDAGAPASVVLGWPYALGGS